MPTAEQILAARKAARERIAARLQMIINLLTPLVEELEQLKQAREDPAA